MAKLISTPEKRTRLTFYVQVKEAKRLEDIRKLAQEQKLNICFKEDFSKWLTNQLNQLEKDLRTKDGKRGGKNG